MSDLLAIGASGIKAYGQALSVVGDNIANAQTEGYVRRSVRLAEAPSGGDIVLSRNSIRPGGVLAAGVTRATDQWLIDDARIAGGEASRQSARLDWVTATESVLADHVTAKLALVAADGKVSVAASDMHFPNGSVITPDGRTLIIGETLAGVLTAFDIAPDGSLSNRRVWAPTAPAIPDGIALDADGAERLPAASKARTAQRMRAKGKR